MFKRMLLNASLIILALITLSVLGAVMMGHAQGIVHFSQSIHQHHVFWMIWRYALMIVFISFYPPIIRFALKNKVYLPKKIINQYAHRKYAIFYCVFYEIIIVHNALAFVINALLD